MLNINNIAGKTVLFLGVGGVSMHQLALAFKQLGANVVGYDHKPNTYTNLLLKHGIKVEHSFNKGFLNAGLCIKTGAIKANNKIVQALNKVQCKIYDRAEALAEMCKMFKTVVAVAGTHGKSTTASLIYEILRLGGNKVSCHIGADVFLPRFNPGDECLVVEACEYNKSFLKLNPTISVITNVEAEHMDSYGSLFNLKNAFSTFLKRGKQRFVFLEKSTKFLQRVKGVNFVETCNLKLNPKIKGEYNLKNIALAVKVCQNLGIDNQTITQAVNSFSGIPRRFELVGSANQTKIYIDYAHHPTEVKAFVSNFENMFENCLIVFQPHTYSRTKTFLKEFVEVFLRVKNLCIFKEYAAREKKSCGLTAKELYAEIKKVNPTVKYAATASAVMKNIKSTQSVAFVGAGDINLVAENICKSSFKKC